MSSELQADYGDKNIIRILGWDETVTPPTIPVTYTKHRPDLFELPDDTDD